MHRSLRTLLAATVTALTIAPITLGAMHTSAAGATPVCDRWASQTGSDLNDGSQGAPVQSLRTLADKLAPGQTGCITNGSTLSWKQDGFLGYGVIAHGGIAGAPITIRPEPGGTANFEGRIEVQSGVTDVVISGLNIHSEANDFAKANLIQVNGDRVTFENNDMTYPGGICIGAGHKATTAYNNIDDIDYADDLVIRGNRIHDCGNSPSVVWTSADSGAHGVYLTFTRRALVTENLIYSNKWRGLQTWPQALDTTITNNLFDGNATHVNVGSALPDGYPWHSERTIVRNNIMTNRVTDWQPSKNPAAIYGNYTATTTPTQYGNVADGNCIDTASAPATGGYGISFGANTTASPTYVDRAHGDFRLTSNSACVGMGPQSIQPATVPPTTTPPTTTPPTTTPPTTTPPTTTPPTTTPPVAPASFKVSVPAPAATKAGATVSSTWTVTNAGGTAGSAYTMLMLAQSVSSPGARLVSIVPNQGTCSVATAKCTLGSIAPGGTATVTVTVDVLRTTGFTLDLTASTVAGQIGEEAFITPTVTGPSCTVIGTNAADTLVGAANKNDVFCGFAGNDTIRPSNGDDVVIGGAGIDTVSYANQTNGVVVNLGQNAAWDNGAGTSIGWDTFTSIESATGTNYADTMIGDANANTLSGGNGNDQLWGYDGDDTLLGGAGADKLYGGNGNDTFDGGAQSDLCRQDAGGGTKAGCETA